MGTASRLERHSPLRLAEKLRHIRIALGLSQNEMLRRLGSPEMLQQGSISGYERGVREPPLLILLEYARIANVYVESLIDDGLDLPEEIPTKVKSEGVKRKSPARAACKARPASKR